MLNARWLQSSMQFLLCILAFALPFPYLFSSYALIALLLLWFIRADYKRTFARLKERKALWLWFVFFAMHVVSYTYSQNKDQSVFDISSKLSFVLMPLLVGAGMSVDRKLFERIMLFFTYSLSAAAIYCVLHAVYRECREEYFYAPFFFYNDLVEGLDASAVYMALYTLMSIATLLFLPWQYYYQGRYKWVKVLMITIQLIFFLMLSSRLLILLFFVLIIPFYLRKLFRHSQLGMGSIFLIFLVFAGLGLAVFMTDNPVKKRYNDIFEKNLEVAWKKDYRNVPQTDFNNITLRLMLWRFCIENMNEHHLWLTGAGNGDAVDLQNAKMAEYGIDVYNPDPKLRSEFYNINVHNMWLQSLLMLGIPGLLVFALIAFTPLFFINKVLYKYVFFVFHISMLFFMFQEASMQTQAGVAYYVFFSTIFWSMYYSRKDYKSVSYINSL